MTQLNPFAHGEQQKPRDGDTSAGLENHYHAAGTNNSLFTVAGQGPPSHDGGGLWLNPIAPKRRTAP
jgi:hypothetical protein